MYDNGTALSGRARRPFLLRLALCCGLLWASFSPSVAHGYVYFVREWKHATYGVIFRISYRSSDDLYNKFMSCIDQQGEVTFASSGTINITVCPSWAMCEFVTPSSHFRPTCSSGGTGWMGHIAENDKHWVRNSGTVWSPHGWFHYVYPNPNHTVTNWVSYTLFKCGKCAGLSEPTLGGYGFSPYDRLANSASVPEWVWGYPSLINLSGVAYSADGNTITGAAWSINPSAMPDGAIATGPNANGYWSQDEDTPPHWVWNPGQEPSGALFTDLADTAQDIYDEVAEMIAGQSAGNSTLENIYNSFSTVNNNVNNIYNEFQTFNTYQAANAAFLEDIASASAGTYDAISDLLDLMVAGGGGTVDFPAAVAANIASTASGVSALVNAQSGVSSQLSAINDNVASLVQNNWYVQNYVLGGQWEPPPVDYEEWDANAFKNDQDKLRDDAVSIGDSITDWFKTFAGALVGNWKNLPRTRPNFKIDFELPLIGHFVNEPNMAGVWDIVEFVRSLEVLALWGFFLFKVCKLVGTLFE
jgi:hypothetical protein